MGPLEGQVVVFQRVAIARLGSKPIVDGDNHAIQYRGYPLQAWNVGARRANDVSPRVRG